MANVLPRRLLIFDKTFQLTHYWYQIFYWKRLTLSEV